MMKRLMIAVCCSSLALSACATTGGVPVSPAPLASTKVDEKALIAVVNGAQAIRSAVDVLVASGVIKPGTPLAAQFREGLIALRDAINAAAAARQSLSATDYAVAIAKATEAGVTLNNLFVQLRR